VKVDQAVHKVRTKVRIDWVVFGCIRLVMRRTDWIKQQ